MEEIGIQSNKMRDRRIVEGKAIMIEGGQYRRG